MAELPSEKREANEKIPKSGTLNKYRWYIIGGLALLAVLVFYFVNKSKANAASTTGGTSSLAAMGIDPATGVPYAQEYSNAFGGGLGLSPYGGGGGGGGGFTGPRGPTGSTGPAGPSGKKGRTGKTGTFKPYSQRIGPGKHGLEWVTPHGVGFWSKQGKHWVWHKAGATGHSKKGSRTEAMTMAVQSRRMWNTRIIPEANQHTYSR